MRQYVYFGLFSRSVSADEMTARLSIDPDDVKVLGSRQVDPPRPAHHGWKIECRERGLQVDEQITAVMRRLAPHRDNIIRLATELKHADGEHGGARLSVVRFFNDEAGEEEILSPPEAEYQKLAGQHQLLGWALEREVLEFLLATGAYLDVDEYG